MAGLPSCPYLVCAARLPAPPTSAFLSLALIFSTSAFYGFYEAAPRLWGLSPEKDQNLGGILMNGEQMIVFFAALSYFLMRLLSEEEEAQRALEG